MATDVVMPRLSDSMEEGTILRWIASEGDEVKRGEPLVEIETDKANMTYESDTDGTLIEIIADEGDTLAIGETIARIGDPGEASSNGGGKRERKSSESGEDEDERQETATATEERDSDGEEADERDSGGEESEERESKGKDEKGAERKEDDGGERRDGASRNGDRVKASPVARRMAEEKGVSLGEIEGSGPGGRIVKADVEAAVADGGKTRDDGEREEKKEGREEKPARPEPVAAGDAGPKGELRMLELNRMQRTISRRMAESKATAPDFHLHVDVDMSRCVELRDRLKEIADVVPSFNDMIVKAAALALRDFPRVNGAYRDGQFELYSRINVGVAVAAQDALIVPTVFDADRKSLGEIAGQVRELVAKVRDGKITPPELSGATFTVSNLGMYGIDSFTAVINPPQAAILAVGALKKKPVVEESGRIVARDLMSMTLVCDHRILYGADGAEFLARTKELLEQPLAFAL